MKDAHYKIHPSKATKQQVIVLGLFSPLLSSNAPQALEVIRALKEVMPIQRAQMRLKIVTSIGISITMSIRLQTNKITLQVI